MKPNHTNPFEVNQKNTGHGQNRQQMRRGSEAEMAPMPDIAELLQRLLYGLRKLFVAFQYKLYSQTLGRAGKMQLPWFKIGLVAFAIFILMKKDIHFSVNMKAPLGDEPTAGVQADQMSLAKAVSFQEKAEPAMALPSDEEVRAYIGRFAKVAVAEMDKFGIPASIQMAQAVLESRAGTTEQARHNNHFSHRMGQGSYESAWENWRTHSLYLCQAYPDLCNSRASCKTWAKQLKKGGYDTSKNYDDTLLDIIDKYKLRTLDN